MDLVDKKGISQIERTGLGFLFWGAMRNLFRYILNGYNFSFLILDAHVKSPFYMNLGIKGFRNYELFKLVIRILNWRIL